jgi:translation initiation factor 1
MSNDSRLVYSSETGHVGPKKSKATSASTVGAPPSTDGIVRIHRSSKGRKGKGVCLIVGLPLVGPELKALAKKLKQACGVGGAVKEGVVEIQGDQRERLKVELEKLGYTVKLAGG